MILLLYYLGQFSYSGSLCESHKLLAVRLGHLIKWMGGRAFNLEFLVLCAISPAKTLKCKNERKNVIYSSV